MENPLFIQTREWLLENGIPEDRSEMIESVNRMTGVDVTSHVTATESSTGDRFSSPRNIREQYSEYRASHRIARAGSHILEDPRFVYLGRTSTTRGSRMYSSIFDVLSRFMSWGASLTNTATKLPMVISEEGDLNLNAELMGDEDHVLIQLVNFDGMDQVDNASTGTQHTIRSAVNPTYFPSANAVISPAHFNQERWDASVAPLVDRLREAEWQIIEMTFAIRGRNTGVTEERSIPIGAIPHDTDERAGRMAVSLMNFRGYNHNIASIIELRGHLHAQMIRVNPPEVPEDVDQSAIDNAMVIYSFMSQARAAVESISANINRIRTEVENREASIDMRREELASMLRVQQDESRTLTEMERATNRVALRSVEETLNLPDVLESMRPIDTVSLTSENGSGVIVEFITHPYAMQCRSSGHYDDDENWVDGRVLGGIVIPKLKVQIDLTQTSFSRATRIERAEGNGAFHPHITGSSICWGDGATALAESFARRDWESFSRLLIAWITQYNDSSPYNSYSALRNSLPSADRSGWLVPEVTAEEVTAEEVTPTAEMLVSV